jgi:phage terminase large subunit-like protein
MWVGVDLAHKIDICAAAKIWRADNGHLHADFKFWLPEGRLEKCSEQMAQMYRGWAMLGKLELTDGDVIDHHQIKADLLDWIGGQSLKEVGFDPGVPHNSAWRWPKKGSRWWRCLRRSATSLRP